MQRIFPTLLFWTLILCACSPSGFSPEAVPATTPQATAIPTEIVFSEVGVATIASPSEDIIPVSTSEILPLPKLIATLSTPHIDPGPDGEMPTIETIPPTVGNCGYQWAYRDLPELTTQFQASLQTLQPEAQANVFAFGEDCVYADGTATFLAMETDFNITVQVSDLSNETELGEWIVKIMQMVESIPKESIVGPRPGRVSIRLQSGSDQKAVTFYIDRYQALPSGLSSAEIYQTLQIPQ